MSLVDTELSAVRQGYDRGVVTREEVCQRFDELERLLWCKVFHRLGQVGPHDGRVPAGGPVGRVPAT